jgi:spermidine synthase
LKNTIDRRITAVVIATGISSVVTQLLVIREFLSQFHGNEFIVALILFNWLFIGGIGTYIASFAGSKASPNRLALVSICLAILSPLELIGIRLLRDVFFIYGSSVGFYPTFAFSFLVITPYCLLLGFALPYSLIVVRDLVPGYSGTRIYIIDNIGDVAGGILFSFILVFTVTPFQAVSIANLILLTASWWMFDPKGCPINLQILGAVVALAVLTAGVWYEKSTLTPPGMEVTFYKESRYGRIEIMKDNEQVTLYLDGKPVFSNQNTDLAEETIHYPLAQLHQTENILLISAEGGAMSEIEKYHPLTVDYIEIDSVVSDALFRFGLVKQVRGLNTIHQDGRVYLARSKKIYNAIVMNLPEPDTFQINRFYTDRFFSLAKSHLAPGGILSFSIEGFDNYPTDAQMVKISSLYHTARKIFKHVLLLPGQKIFFLCSDQPLNSDIPKLLEEKKIQTRYIRGFYYGNLSDERIRYLNDQIQADVPVNSDYSPHLIRLMFTEWFKKFSTSPKWLVMALALILMIYLTRISKVEFLLFSTGFMIMGSEILVIFVFQISFGYIYQQIGIIVTVFLAGLFPGAMLGESIRKRSRQALLLTDAALILLMLMLISALMFAGDRLTPGLIVVFGFLISVACGCQFPVALHLRGGHKKAMIEVFSADLMGAAFGILVTSVILIPYIGIIGSALCLISLKLISMTVIQTNHEIVV